MAVKRLAQRTLVRMMEVLTEARPNNFSRLLYEHDFPDWFVAQAGTGYHFNWDEILIALRNGYFFFPRNEYFSTGKTLWGGYLDPTEAKELGEQFIQKLAALAATFPKSDSLVNALKLEGLSADIRNLRLMPLESIVSAQEEEDALTALVKRTGITDSGTLLKHVTDAGSLYVQKKYHSSLNESRSLLQCLIDNIGGDTHKSRAHANGFPGGTANRIDYLRDVGFLTADEAATFKSAWGALSAGSHPGVPEPEEARIGLILALEFGQTLLLKFESWKAGKYKKFAR